MSFQRPDEASYVVASAVFYTALPLLIHLVLYGFAPCDAVTPSASAAEPWLFTFIFVSKTILASFWDKNGVKKRG